jgi:hypothetical protein
MKRTRWTGAVLVVLLAGVAVVAVGCGKEKEKVAQAQDGPKGHDHSGWWCAEHGVPEAICGQCNADYAAECQKKGDWCKEHQRPESQCFICRPELKEKFAEQYRTKYGKEPPPMEEATKKDDKKEPKE